MIGACPSPFHRAVAGATAALSGRASVTIAYGTTETATVRDNDILLPASPSRQGENVGHVRGLADSAAFRMRHHDVRIHATEAPSGADARVVFDACEQARTDALGARRLPGVAVNLQRRAAYEVRAEGFDRAQGREHVPVAWALRTLLQARASGRVPPETARAAAALWWPFIEERAAHSFDAAARAIDDQTAFSRAVHRLLADLGLTDRDGDAEEPDAAGTDGDATPETPEAVHDGEPAAGEIAGSEPAIGAAEEGGGAAAEGKASDAVGPPMPSGPGAHLDGRGNVPDGPALRYHVFTTAHDAVVDAANLADADEMARLRLSLDRKLRGFQTLVARLANRLQRRLLARQARSWEFDVDEGVVDAARLAQVVANPALALPYKRERETRFRDTVITLLLDNSGSMRGRPITVAALCADILSRTLERCGVRTEVLGFTTGAWKGGSSRDDWVAAGKPRDPGRLNDLLHIVYKAADEPLRRARHKFGLMLREGLLKENIDGEALAWAHRRLLARPEQRRILMVISDGAPVDDSTLSANAANYLDRHLRHWIHWIEARSPVELVAIGIGHDVTRYYRRAATISEIEQLGGVMMEQLGGLFDDLLSRAVRG